MQFSEFDTALKFFTPTAGEPRIWASYECFFLHIPHIQHLRDHTMSFIAYNYRPWENIELYETESPTHPVLLQQFVVAGYVEASTEFDRSATIDS